LLLLRFLFDGERVQEDQIPSQLQMADGDVIDAVALASQLDGGL